MWGYTPSEEKDLHFSYFKAVKFCITCSKPLWYDSQCSSLQNAENFKQYNDLLSLFGFFLWHFVISEQVLTTFDGGAGISWGSSFSHPVKNIAGPSLGHVCGKTDYRDGEKLSARLTREMVRNSHHNHCAIASQKTVGWFHSDVIVQKRLLVVLVVTVT